jgi:hypothetical protein
MPADTSRFARINQQSLSMSVKNAFEKEVIRVPSAAIGEHRHTDSSSGVWPGGH